jgi:hypothetical protein
MGRFESFTFGSERERRRADAFMESLDELDRPRGRRDLLIPEDQPNPSTPPGLRLVDHFHFASRCEDGRWVAASSPSKVQPSQLDPGFLDSAGGLVLDTRLDNSLIDLLVSEHSKFLTPQSVARRWPHVGDLIHVCIVDMSRGALCRPRYAGWGSHNLFLAGSTAKVALLYAAHQLISDLGVLAERDGITDLPTLKLRALAHWGGALADEPDVEKLAVFDGSVVRPSQHLRETVEMMIHRDHSRVSTSKANVVLKDIGFDYVASLLWQSGLRNPTAKGLWFPNDFGRARSWARDPFREGRIGLTARSVATFYTLLAQGRLVSPHLSGKMEGILRNGCRFSMPSGVTVRATKCGLIDAQQESSALRHNSALLSAPRDLLYAVVCLTRGKAKTTVGEMEKLMSGIHRLVERRNA